MKIHPTNPYHAAQVAARVRMVQAGADYPAYAAAKAAYDALDAQRRAEHDAAWEQQRQNLSRLAA